MSNEPPPRIAVLIRTHFVSQMLRSMIDELKGHALFDVYVTPNESQGALDIPGCAKISYSREMFKSIGFEARSDFDIVYCSDLLFEYYRRCIPQYDFYVLVEYDVAATGGSGDFFDNLARKLGSEFRDLDAAGPLSGPVWEGWYHCPKAMTFFPKVYQFFFPLVVMSRQAIEYIYEWRMREDCPSGNMQDRVFCEALVVSALEAANRGFRCADLNEIVPDSYSLDTFYFGLPMLDGLWTPKFEQVQITHPVYPSAHFLEAHFRHATNSNTLLQFRAVLDEEELPIEGSLLSFWRERAATALSERGAQVQSQPAEISAGDRSHPPVVLLVEDSDLPLRGPGAANEPRVLAPVGELSLLELVLNRLLAGGCRTIYVTSRFDRGDIDDALTDWRSKRDVAGGAAPIEIIFSQPTDEPLGCRIRRASEVLGGRLVVSYGHHVSDLTIPALLAVHSTEGKPVTVAAAQPAAVVAALDADLNILIQRAPRTGTHWTDAGCLVFEPEAWDYVGPDQVHKPSDLLQFLEWKGQLAIHEHQGFWQGADTQRELDVLRRLSRSGDLPRVGQGLPSERHRGP